MLSTSCFGSFILEVCADASHYDHTGLAQSLVSAIGYAEHCIEDDWETHLQGVDAEQELQLRWLRMRRERIEDALHPSWREVEWRRRYEGARAWLELRASELPVLPVGENIPF